MVWQRTEKYLNSIQNHPPGANGIDRMTQADEESFQVIFSRLCDLAAVKLNMIDDQFFLLFQSVQVKTKRGNVLCQFFGIFLKRHKDARFIILDGPIDKKFHCEERLT